MNLKNKEVDFLSSMDALNLNAAKMINTLFQDMQKKHNLSECTTYQLNRLQPLVLALALNGYGSVNQPNHPVTEFLEVASQFSRNISKMTDERYKFLSLIIGDIVYVHANPYECFLNASHCLKNYEKDMILAKYLNYQNLPKDFNEKPPQTLTLSDIV